VVGKPVEKETTRKS